MSEISIIVPIYNVELYLRRCIDSILDQSYRDFELILVNDGSPDNCGSICDEYARIDSRVQVIHQDNRGLSAARNAGLDRVFKNNRSHWITFVDSDDWLHPQYLSALHNATRNTGMSISTCKFIRTSGATPSITAIPQPILFPPEEFYTVHPAINTIACGKLYRKELFDSVRFPLGKLHEDEFVIFRLLFSIDEIAVVDAPLYFYYINDNGITKSGWTPAHFALLEARKLQLEFLSANGYLSAYEFVYQFYLRDLIATNHNIKNHPYQDRKTKRKHLSMVKKDTRHALRKYALTSTPTIKTHPQVFEIAYPWIVYCYWQNKGILCKTRKILCARRNK